MFQGKIKGCLINLETNDKVIDIVVCFISILENNILVVVIVRLRLGRSLIIFMSSDYWVLMIYEDEGRPSCHPPVIYDPEARHLTNPNH